MTRRPNIAALTFLAIFIASCTTTQSMNKGPALADSKVTREQKIERPRSKSAAESEKQENKETGADVAGFLPEVLLTGVLLAGSAM